MATQVSLSMEWLLWIPASVSPLPPPRLAGYHWGMVQILAVEYGASYAKPPAIFYLVATVSTILYFLYLRRRFAMRRKRESDSKSPPDAP